MSRVCDFQNCGKPTGKVRGCRIHVEFFDDTAEGSFNLVVQSTDLCDDHRKHVHDLLMEAVRAIGVVTPTPPTELPSSKQEEEREEFVGAIPPPPPFYPRG